MPFSVVVTKVAWINEEYQIKAWLDTVLVQAENFPNLAFCSVSFNGIPEFLGQGDAQSNDRTQFIQRIRQSGEFRPLTTLFQGGTEHSPEFFALLQAFGLRKASSHRKH